MSTAYCVRVNARYFPSMKIKKNVQAQKLVALRWAKTTPEQRSQMARDMNAKRWGKVAKLRTPQKDS